LNNQSNAHHRKLREYVLRLGTVMVLIGGGMLATNTAAAAEPKLTAIANGASASKVSRPGDLQFLLPAGFSSQHQFLEVQDRLRRAADELRQAVDKGHWPGFAGIELSIARRLVTLYWHGTLPRDIDDLIATQHADAAVVVKPAHYSHQQLVTVAEKLVKESVDGTGTHVVRVTIPVDGHALEIGVENAARQRAQLAASAHPVQVVVTEDKPALAAFSRMADSPPFWGGARTINTRTGWGCSTGFAINTNGTTAMLSAGHCGDVGDTIVNGVGSLTLGQVIQDVNLRDTMVISTNAAGRVYDGDWLSSSSRPVAGTAFNYPGLYTCTLGGFSGGRCDVAITETYVWKEIDGGLMGPLVEAEQVQHTNAAGEGDSGGPVISLTGPDWSQLLANGTITALDLNTTVTCTGVQGRVCGWRIYFADVKLALVRHNASIMLG
jgi:hypothetical protein